MTEQTPGPSSPRWLQIGFALILSAQLALLWLQGMQLNRQHHDLAGLREDLQFLTESLEQHSGGPQESEEGYAPARVRHAHPSLYQRVHRQEEDKDASAAAKELQASKESGQKAVKDARKVQSQLSISENAKKAEEKAKVKEAVTTWEMWALAAGAVVLVAFLVRGWLKSREE